MEAFLSFLLQMHQLLQALQGTLQTELWAFVALSVSEPVPTAELREA